MQRQKGVAKVQEREAAIAAFRARFGPLDGPTVSSWQGWTRDDIYLPACNQTRREWTDPRGNKWLLMKDLEANFGQMMLNGDDVDSMPEIQELVNSNLGDPDSKKKREKKAKIERNPLTKRFASEQDYAETTNLVIVKLKADTGMKAELKDYQKLLKWRPLQEMCYSSSQSEVSQVKSVQRSLL